MKQQQIFLRPERSRRGRSAGIADKSRAEDTDRGHVSSSPFFFLEEERGYDSVGGR